MCGRTCAWWNGLGTDLKAEFFAANDEYVRRLNAGVVDFDNPFNYEGSEYALYLSREEDRLFGEYCSQPNADQYGFPGREMLNEGERARQGSINVVRFQKVDDVRLQTAGIGEDHSKFQTLKPS